MDLEKTEKIIPAIYEASLDDEAWSILSRQLSDLFVDTAVGLASQSMTKPDESFCASARFDPECSRAHFEEYYRPDNNPAVKVLLTEPLGKLITLPEVLDEKLYQSDPGARAILHPQRIDKAIMSPLERNGAFLDYVIYLRRDSQEEFEAEHSTALHMLNPHISAALKLRRFLQKRRLEYDATKVLFENKRDIQGVIILAPSGVIVDADPSAQFILDLNEGLGVRFDRLTSVSTNPGQDRASLRDFLRANRDRPESFVISDGRSVVSLEHWPFFLGTKENPGGSYRMLNVRRVSLRPEPVATITARAFNLTVAEERLVGTLKIEPNATEAAKALGLSRETIKSHLSRIYQKTGVTSLSQLMLLVGRLD